VAEASIKTSLKEKELAIGARAKNIALLEGRLQNARPTVALVGWSFEN
jgi:hypothetical protein